MNTIGPSDEISRMIASASVVLPDPLSPTTPSVSPCRTQSVAALTALTWPTVRLSRPRWIGNQMRRSSVRTTSAAPSGTGSGAPVDSADSSICVYGCVGAREDLLGRATLDDLAVLHHADPVGEAPHDAEVVGDEEHAHPLLALQLGQKLEDLRLDRDVERGRRFVGDQQVGPVRQRHGDHHPLALPARKLVRIGAQPAFGVLDADLVEQLEDPRPRRLARKPLMQQPDFRLAASRACGAG